MRYISAAEAVFPLYDIVDDVIGFLNRGFYGFRLSGDG
jgi:hypothetical protein